MASTKTQQQQQQPSAGVLGGINSPEQLQQLKSQLEEDIQLLISSLKQLKVVQSKLVQSKEAVEQLGESKEGQSVLVPLTSSMYVPGQLGSTSKVLVDIGTNYYVEKDRKGALDFFQRKIEYVTKSMEGVQQALKEKDVMRDRLMQYVMTTSK